MNEARKLDSKVSKVELVRNEDKKCFEFCVVLVKRGKSSSCKYFINDEMNAYEFLEGLKSFADSFFKEFLDDPWLFPDECENEERRQYILDCQELSNETDPKRKDELMKEMERKYSKNNVSV